LQKWQRNLGSKKGGKLDENLRDFNFTPTIIFHEFVRHLKVMRITIKVYIYIYMYIYTHTHIYTYI